MLHLDLFQADGQPPPVSLFGQIPKKKRKRKSGGSRGSIAWGRYGRAWDNCEDSDNSEDDHQVQEIVGYAMILSGSRGT